MGGLIEGFQSGLGFAGGIGQLAEQGRQRLEQQQLKGAVAQYIQNPNTVDLGKVANISPELAVNIANKRQELQQQQEKLKLENLQNKVKSFQDTLFKTLDNDEPEESVGALIANIKESDPELYGYVKQYEGVPFKGKAGEFVSVETEQGIALLNKKTGKMTMTPFGVKKKDEKGKGDFNLRYDASGGLVINKDLSTPLRLSHSRLNSVIKEDQQKYDALNQVKGALANAKESDIPVVTYGIARILNGAGVLTEQDVRAANLSQSVKNKLNSAIKHKFEGRFYEGELTNGKEFLKTMLPLIENKINKSIDREQSLFEAEIGAESGSAKPQFDPYRVFLTNLNGNTGKKYKLTF